jgi:hypothetical protein
LHKAMRIIHELQVIGYGEKKGGATIYGCALDTHTHLEVDQQHRVMSYVLYLRWTRVVGTCDSRPFYGEGP